MLLTCRACASRPCATLGRQPARHSMAGSPPTAPKCAAKRARDAQARAASSCSVHGRSSAACIAFKAWARCASPRPATGPERSSPCSMACRSRSTLTALLSRFNAASRPLPPSKASVNSASSTPRMAGASRRGCTSSGGRPCTRGLSKDAPNSTDAQTRSAPSASPTPSRFWLARRTRIRLGSASSCTRPSGAVNFSRLAFSRCRCPTPSTASKLTRLHRLPTQNT